MKGYTLIGIGVIIFGVILGFATNQALFVLAYFGILISAVLIGMGIKEL